MHFVNSVFPKQPIDPIDAARLQFEELRDRSGSGEFDVGARRFDSGDSGDSWPSGGGGGGGLLSDSLPGYALGCEIHRGGQGVVYQATQSSTGRTVAIKFMREGLLASRHDALRLEREVQILGRLHHRNIVGVLDSGSSAGHHYFVMDYVDGQPLDVRAAGLGQRDVLELFAKICDAMHAAHVRGVIHRDLKPSNILIDANGEPNILDFGLAKVMSNAASEDALDAHTAVTMTGQFVGSLPWASPEQASGSSASDDDQTIDIRSDVYSLGVMLYQVLTGTFPYRVIGAMRDVLDNIVNAEPAPPSSINRAIDDEVGTIVLKCLNKEPERRYQTAGELGRDIRHYLANEPIEAKRDSFTYVLRKQLHRHRVAVGIAAGFVVLIAVGFVVSLGLWQAAVRERNEKEAQRLIAVAEAAKARAVNQFLNEMFASANPELAKGQDVTVRQTLDEAALGIDAGAFSAQPEVEASIRLTIGEAYLALGQFEQAGHHLRTALDIAQRLHGMDHASTAEYLNALGELRRQEVNPEEAEKLHRRALSILQTAHGDDHIDVAQTLTALALTVQELGRSDEAGQHLERALAITQRLYGAKHPRTARAKFHLAMNMHGGEQPVTLLREAIEINRAALGPKHPDIPRTLQYLAAMLHMQGDYAGAERTYVEAIDLATQIHGPSHPNVIKSVQNLSFLYQSTNQNDTRIQLLTQHQRAAEGAFGRESVLYADYLNSLGAALGLSGAYAEGAAAFDEALLILKAIGRDREWLGAECRNSLAVLHLKAERYDDAERMAREVLALHEDQNSIIAGSDANPTDLNPREERMHAQAQSLLGEALMAKRQFAQAESYLLAGYEGLVKARATAVYRSRAVERLVRLYETWESAEPKSGKAEQASKWRDEGAAIAAPRE